MLSGRSPLDLRPTNYARALEERRSAGTPLLDLTLSNPTIAGFTYPDGLLVPLAHPAAHRYDPQPLGLPEAREAVAADYARKGMAVPPGRIALTASTSEAYAILFKLLCDAGDEVLVPAPSYPLFEHLARLESVQVMSYPLEYHGRWTIDLEGLRRATSPRTRAVIVVSPNNPTGSFVTHGELQWLADFCAERALALIGDEVFADYAFDAGGPSVVSQETALAFALGGLSKSAGLPQIKLGWMALAGPAPLVGECLPRLELILDTYLSVSTPVQRAARELIAAGADIRRQIRERTATNLTELCRLLTNVPELDLLALDGGWTAVLRVPSREGEEALALELLNKDDVIVHPGYFFDFPREAYLILSLLPPPDDFAQGARRVIERSRG